MTVADDLIAVRTLLILRGRAIGALEDDDGRVCLRGAMKTVSAVPFRCDIDIDIDPEAWEAAWSASVVEPRARDAAMCDQLRVHLPGALKACDDIPLYDPQGNFDVLATFNDGFAACDQDVFDLIEKALADLGAI